MRFLTEEETRGRVEAGYSLDSTGSPLMHKADGDLQTVHRIPQETGPAMSLPVHLGRLLQPWTTCLLWVTDWDIYPENWHLYYRLRQTYGDIRLIGEAPGHLFLHYEAADLVSFLQLAVLFGWEAYVLPREDYARAFLSSDGIIEFWSNSSATIKRFADPLGEPLTKA